MEQRKVIGGIFRFKGKPNRILTTAASQTADGTWTAEIVQEEKGITLTHRYITGFESLIQALRTANETALALADEQASGWVGYAAEDSPTQEEREPSSDTN